MKAIILTAVIGSFLAVAGAVQATEFVTDPLLKDLAMSGSVINPHGITAGN